MATPFWVQISIAATAVIAWMTVLWLLQRKTGNAGIVDAGWASAIGALGVFFALTFEGFGPRRVLVASLLGAWSFRLSLYLLVDRVIGQPEEGRYRTMRQNWGDSAQKRLFLFFQIQAFVALLFALPAWVACCHTASHWTAWDLIGVAVWCVSFVNTAVADRQLVRFKRRPENRGKTCRQGWWRYSRHPNYFFEWLHWWSYAAFSVGAAYWWISFLAPLLMLYFLLRVTGIPPTEAQALANRGDDYRRYQRTTSAFFPWFPKKDDDP